MNNLNNHDDESSHDENSSRRKFVRAIGVVPVTLTISARSALAATCTTVSAAGSIALTHSHNSQEDVGLSPCVGLSPSSWAAPSANFGAFGNDNFSGIFASGINASMKQILTNSNSLPRTPTNFEKTIAAAYLNVQLVKVAGYTLSNLTDMWNAAPNNNYHPVPGANWGESDITTYLTNTWLSP